MIEPPGCIFCLSILSRHSLFPLLISKASSSPITSVRLCLDFWAHLALLSVCCLRRCLASRIRVATCLPVSRNFILSFGDHNLRSDIFSCNTFSWSFCFGFCFSWFKIFPCFVKKITSADFQESISCLNLELRTTRDSSCCSSTRQTPSSHQSVTRDDIADIISHLVLIASTHCMSWLPWNIVFGQPGSCYPTLQVLRWIGR